MHIDVAYTIKECQFFWNLSDAALKRLIEMASTKRYARGEIIFRQGDPVPGIFIIASGKVKVFRVSANGKEHVLHLLEAGDTFAEIAALGEFEAVPAFAEALNDSICVLLPREPFQAALRQDHQLCLQILASMASWVKHFVTLLEGIVLRDAIGRVADYLLNAEKKPGHTISLQTLKKHIASHLNLTSETLSRTLRQLCDQGLIDSDDKGVTIKHRARLRQVAEGNLSGGLK